MYHLPVRGRAGTMSSVRARRRHAAAIAGLVSALAGSAGAQVVPGEGASIGTSRADRLRLAQIRGAAADTSAELRVSERRGWVLSLIPLMARASYNSALPSGGNDGALWAGRGLNGSATGGLRARGTLFGQTVDLAVAPAIVASENRPFSLYRGREPNRSAFSSPWHLADASADLPLRFGDRPFSMITPGESELTVTAGRLAGGASASGAWWGPAIRNTLVLSNNAGGIPRLFVRTSRPVPTRLGLVDARLFIGALAQSPFFDASRDNDVRPLSGALATLRPAVDTGLTIGVSRLVMSPGGARSRLLRHFADAVRPRARAMTLPDTASAAGHGADQLVSLFARWVFPASGFETWAEWAQMEGARSARSGQSAPPPSGGYTVGLQWADPSPGPGFLRLQVESTYLEQTGYGGDGMPQDFYTGRAAPQGFTQRGQVIGAAIGPGSSAQFLAADWIGNGWQGGAFAGRTRLENDALYRQTGARLTQHDVTIYSGVRFARRVRDSDLAGELSVARRMNYLFQNDYYLGNPLDATDIQNVTVTVTVSPH